MKEIVYNLHRPIPAFLQEALEAPAMKRLLHVGMNCGCEYTSYPCFTALPPYSRYEHSLGVALIVWRFTQDEKQALSGLFHDIATPVFAHVIDFMRGDYVRQEATEDGTARLIEEDPVIRKVLRDTGLSVRDVCDYHCYPIADNEAPKLCADRLEYTLENMVHYRHATVNDALRMYEDLEVSDNEDGSPELVFRTPSLALRFAENALKCGMFYTTDQDRYSMQRLSEICRDAVLRGVITEADLYKDEPYVIGRFLSDPKTAAAWNAFRKLSVIRKADDAEVSTRQNAPNKEMSEAPGFFRKIDAKKRCIDPYIKGLGRVSSVDPAFCKALRDFRNTSFDYWVFGE